VIGVVLTRIRTDGRLEHIWSSIRVWLYVDDILFQCPRQHVRTLVEVVVETMEQFSMQLQHRKCGIHIPALASTPLDEWPVAARQ